VIAPDGRTTMYGNVRPAMVEQILRRHVRPVGITGWTLSGLRRLWRLLRSDEAWEDPAEHVVDHTGEAGKFLAGQQRIVTDQAGRMDPTDIDEYRANGGYKALARVVAEMSPEAVIAEIGDSGLRGRGGAGFPSGSKWRLVADQPAGPKYVVCNGDEGDPGAFMDRMLLEAYPHRILEGLAIAAYAVGAEGAILYIRQEYALAVRHVAEAIMQAESAGLLGGGILGTNFSLNVRITQGAGAFVCGEETALIASLEGRRGTPRLRPPYPAECGLWGRPTLVSNVETFACVPWIITNGAQSFAKLGTAGSKGTKVFSLTGKVARGGLIEVEMGTTIGRIVNDLGGGGKDGRKFKAVQIGGPSGGCIPAELADTPVDYEALVKVGAMMGSGGLVVLDQTDCMVDIARYFLQFTQNESCGKCTFCRIGTKRMLEILNRLCNGQGRAEELVELEELAGHIQAASLCGLGQTAPNPVLTTLKYFRDEYEAHLAGFCPAGKCTALIKYSVTDDCIGCTRCAQVCPVDAIEGRPYEKHHIDMSKCTCCHMCVPACPTEAIRVD
ncbi:MAG: 4Fe-4S binding protein, partial [Planctomycetes bacterium]|nr:4Fe-4S binding protein [Planctomycetota bacterium]